jgi:hypothetical protein
MKLIIEKLLGDPSVASSRMATVRTLPWEDGQHKRWLNHHASTAARCGQSDPVRRVHAGAPVPPKLGPALIPPWGASKLLNFLRDWSGVAWSIKLTCWRRAAKPRNPLPQSKPTMPSGPGRVPKTQDGKLERADDDLIAYRPHTAPDAPRNVPAPTAKTSIGAIGVQV